MHKHAKGLTGYIEDNDLKRLENIKNLVFPTYRKNSVSTARDAEGVEKDMFPSRRHSITQTEKTPKPYETQYNRLSSLKMVNLDYDGAVHGPIHENAAVIDYDHVHNWQNGPTVQEIVNNRILQSEQRKREAIILNNDSQVNFNEWKRGSAHLHQFQSGYDTSSRKVGLAAHFGPSRASVNVGNSISISG
jgi:hypothetical protein